MREFNGTASPGACGQLSAATRTRFATDNGPVTYTFASATVLLLLICDPLGNIPIFANALRHVALERRAGVILREVLIAFVLLLAFMFVGDSFLRVMGLSGLSLQIAGAVVLFLIALRMKLFIDEKGWVRTDFSLEQFNIYNNNEKLAKYNRCIQRIFCWKQKDKTKHNRQYKI